MKVCYSGAGREITRIRPNNQFHPIVLTIELISHAGNELLRVAEKLVRRENLPSSYFWDR